MAKKEEFKRIYREAVDGFPKFVWTTKFFLLQLKSYPYHIKKIALIGAISKMITGSTSVLSAWLLTQILIEFQKSSVQKMITTPLIVFVTVIALMTVIKGLLKYYRETHESEIENFIEFQNKDIKFQKIKTLSIQEFDSRYYQIIEEKFRGEYMTKGVDFIFQVFTISVSIVIAIVALQKEAIWIIPPIFVAAVIRQIFLIKNRYRFYDFEDSRTLEEKQINSIYGVISSRQGFMEHLMKGKIKYLYERAKELSFVILNARKDISKTVSVTNLKIGWLIEIIQFIPFIIMGTRAIYFDVDPKVVIFLVMSFGIISYNIDDFVELLKTYIDASRVSVFFYNFMNFSEGVKRGDEVFCEESKNTISFKDVLFSYPGSESIVIQNINYEFISDVRYSIIGKNGEGKSTFLKLLLGMYPSTYGSVRINNTNTYSFSNESFLKKVGYISNSPYYLDELSFGEALTLEKDWHARTNEIITILELVGVWETVQERGGLDASNLTSRYDVEFSSGQYQRLALASLLLRKDLWLVVMDEPTSAIDMWSEEKLLTLVMEKFPHAIIIFVTHSKQVAMLADIILSIEDGMLSSNSKFLLGSKKEVMN